MSTDDSGDERTAASAAAVGGDDMLARALELSLLSPYPLGAPPIEGVVVGAVFSALLFLGLATLLVGLTVRG